MPRILNDLAQRPPRRQSLPPDGDAGAAASSDGPLQLARRCGTRLCSHHVGAVGKDRRDEAEHVAVGVEQVPHPADALHIRQRQSLRPTELQSPPEHVIDAAVDADNKVTTIDRSPAFRSRPLALSEPR